MHSEKKQEEQGRLTEEWCSHRHEGHDKRINRGTVGSSKQKQERKGKQRGKEAGAAEMRDKKEWWEMPREALQGANVRQNDNSKVFFCFVNAVALAKQS